MSVTRNYFDSYLFAAVVSAVSISANLVNAQSTSAAEEITVWGQGRPVDESHRSSSTVLMTKDDLVSINPMTTEDLLKFEPSLIIRQRFIGDPNGTMGLRTASMFQTARTSVYADGVPLHYFLQTSFNGSPRWALVGADEVGSIEVVYGPFSAEYGGNAMGGVINFETKIPTIRTFHLEGSMFQNDFEEVGFKDKLNGRRVFGSYGDKFGNLSLYSSWIHLENDSQPMDFRFSPILASATGIIQPVNGGIAGKSSTDTDVINWGDTGVQEVNTDQFKVKVGYDFGDWFSLFNVAYENRARQSDNVNNYLVSSTTGLPVWNGNVRTPGGQIFNVTRSSFTEDESDRQNILLAGRLQGPITSSWWLEANVSYYDMLQDETRSSLQHPDDPTFTPAGRIRDFDNTGWKTADIKLETDELFGRDDLELVTGYQYANYTMTLSDYNSPDYRAGVFGTVRNTSGGETITNALYAQLGWGMTDQWDMVLGARQEFWDSRNGQLYNYTTNNLQDHADRSVDKLSPKFSIGFTPNEDWRFRYSLAKAYRFPIVEELFSYESSTVGTGLADVNLAPEDGLHHNLMVERGIGNGYVRVNFLYETINDVIFSQSGTVDNVLIRTFLPVDEVKTKGAELVYTEKNVLDTRLDIQANLTLMHSEITRNSLNPAIEGNDFPRLPKCRGNVVLTYHITNDWDFGGGLRYATKAFQQLDNSDIGHQTYAVMDKYTFVNLKTNYHFNENLRMSLAVDNVFNKLAYVNHPYPFRTVFLETALDF